MERESITRRNIFGNTGWFTPQLKRKDISDNVNEWRRVRARGKQNLDDRGCQTMGIENVRKEKTITKGLKNNGRRVLLVGLTEE